ncbi:MAG: hypothetical protein AB7K86_08615 [Rhodospirillales bacterium]
MNWGSLFPILLDGASAFIDAKGREERAEASQRDRAAVLASNQANAVVADGNAQIAEWQAADAIQRSRYQASKIRGQGRQLQADQQVAFAASGVALTSGSVAHVLASTETAAEVDALNTEDSGQREAWALRLNAMDSRNRAKILRAAEAPVADDPNRAFTAGLLSGAVRAFDNYERRQPRIR